MLPAFAKHTVTVLRAGVQMDHGTEIPDWSEPTETTVSGCSVQPTFGEEETSHRDAVQSEYTVYMPKGTDVDAYCRIVWKGKTYEVVGNPSVWDVPMSSVEHVAVHMNLWEG